MGSMQRGYCKESVVVLMPGAHASMRICSCTLHSSSQPSEGCFQTAHPLSEPSRCGQSSRSDSLQQHNPEALKQPPSQGALSSAQPDGLYCGITPSLSGS